jgi:hypothetical protein
MVVPMILLCYVSLACPAISILEETCYLKHLLKCDICLHVYAVSFKEKEFLQISSKENIKICKRIIASLQPLPVPNVYLTLPSLRM